MLTHEEETTMNHGEIIHQEAGCQVCGSHKAGRGARADGYRVCVACAHNIDAHGAGLHDAYMPDPCTEAGRERA